MDILCNCSNLINNNHWYSLHRQFKKAVKRRTIELEKEIAIRKNTEENLKN
jgi:hypothetical protein